MIFNLNQIIKNYDGTNLTEKEEGKDKNLTFLSLVTQALNQVDQTTPSDEKAKRFFLTKRAYDNPEAVDYKSEDIVLIMDSIRKNFFPIAVGRCEEFFDNPISKDQPSDNKDQKAN